MAEVKFIIKCFIFTSLLVVLMQVKVGSASIEAYTFHWLRNSTASQYVQSVAAGGAMALRNLVSSAKEAANSTINGYQAGSSEKAIR